MFSLSSCPAGPLPHYFESDKTKTKYYLTCLPDNKFSEPDWPNCMSGTVRFMKLLRNWLINELDLSKFLCMN